MCVSRDCIWMGSLLFALQSWVYEFTQSEDPSPRRHHLSGGALQEMESTYTVNSQIVSGAHLPRLQNEAKPLFETDLWDVILLFQKYSPSKTEHSIEAKLASVQQNNTFQLIMVETSFSKHLRCILNDSGTGLMHCVCNHVLQEQKRCGSLEDNCFSNHPSVGERTQGFYWALTGGTVPPSIITQRSLNCILLVRRCVCT